jgi:hypothetical protein
MELSDGHVLRLREDTEHYKAGDLVWTLDFVTQDDGTGVIDISGVEPTAETRPDETTLSNVEFVERG